MSLWPGILVFSMVKSMSYFNCAHSGLQLALLDVRSQMKDISSKQAELSTENLKLKVRIDKYCSSEKLGNFSTPPPLRADII